MIPTIDEEITLDQEETEVPSKDYRLDEDSVNGTVDKLEEIKQAIYFILNTERYEHAIYDWDYGFEVSDLIGQDYVYVKAVLEDRIREALTQDERINTVDGFKFEKKKNQVTATFTVTTDFGTTEEETTINV